MTTLVVHTNRLCSPEWRAQLKEDCAAVGVFAVVMLLFGVYTTFCDCTGDSEPAVKDVAELVREDVNLRLSFMLKLRFHFCQRV